MRERQEDRCASNFETKVLLDNSRAEALWKRHQDLVRSHRIVHAILAFAEGNEAPLDQIRDEVGDVGAFLMDYEQNRIWDRLVSKKNWIVAEAGGCIIEGQRRGPFEWMADCQCYIPDDHAGSIDPRYISLPRPERGDYVIAESVARKIAECPACAGCLADLCVEDRGVGLRFAGNARETAFQQIERVERDNPIRYMTAEIFSIRGLMKPDGTTIYPSVSVTNIASILVHEHSRRYPATLGWILKERNVKVCLTEDKPSNPHILLTDWFVMIYDFDFIRKVKRRKQGLS